jgi:hypothetical protein
MYRVPFLHLMPSTDFFIKHPNEMQEALKPKATWEFLQRYALPKIALGAGMSEAERKAHGYSGNVQYYDSTINRWLSVNVRRIQWFDGRELLRETVARTKEDFHAVVSQRLAKLRQKAEFDPTPKHLAEVAGYEKYVVGQFQANLRRFDAQKRSARAWLANLDATPDFSKALFTLLREAENEVREARGLSAVGEAWVSETELLYRVRELLPGVDVLAHAQPKWLGRQHLDIWIPSLSVAIEYHGLQHFQSVEFFGGEDAFRRGQELDERKRSLCDKNGIRLVEIAHDQEIDDQALRTLIYGS